MSTEQTVLSDPISEGTTRILTGVITDAYGVPLPADQVDTLTVLLYEFGSKALVNSRDHQDILGTNGGTLGTDGAWALELAPADTVILNVGSRREKHVALIEWEYQGGKRGKHEIVHYISNLYGVPA